MTAPEITDEMAQIVARALCRAAEIPEHEWPVFSMEASTVLAAALAVAPRGDGAASCALPDDDPLVRLITPVPGATGYAVWRTHPGDRWRNEPLARFVVDSDGRIRRAPDGGGVTGGDGVAGE